VTKKSDKFEPVPVIESWDTYWDGAQSSAAFSGGGSTDPLILSFWDDYFQSVLVSGASPRIIDIASGNGAVVEAASKVFGDRLPPFTCLDVSAAAINMLEQRFPGVTGVVADAANSPLPAASFDIVTSQFGVEYAGLEAIESVSELVAPGGDMRMLLHHRDGLIYEQCDSSLNAIRDMKNSEFIPLCIAMFETGYETLAGGDKEAYRVAGNNFSPAIQAMEAIMTRYGRDVAASTIVRVYRDVRTIHQRMKNYEPSAVVGWLEKMQAAIDAYEGRMASMLDVAIDATQFAETCGNLEQRGFEISRAEPLARSPQDLPLAWVVVARRQ
jgi:SAM-dependent methyltransferase